MTTLNSRRLADRYDLADVIGEGGMGAVWRAEDTLLRRAVAIKELRMPAQLAASEQQNFEARVLREARVAAGLTHPNLVTVYDVLEEEGRTFIVMELVSAPTLADVVAGEGPMPPDRVAAVASQLAAALASAHEKGIVHRDVKPANVMLTADGTVKLGDFGIASVKGDPSLTASGVILGSPAYMAPEQAEGKPSGPPTDVWGLGATLYFALTGRNPFDKGQPIATLASVVHDDLPPLDAGPAGDVVGGMLAKDPAARPSMAEVHAQLEQGPSEATAVAASPLSETRLLTEEEPLPFVRADAPRQARARDRAAPANAPRIGTGWAIALVLVVLAVIAAAILASRDPGDSEGDRQRERARGAPAPAEERDDAGGDEDAAPAEDGGEWARYENEAGFAIDYPAAWEQVPGRGGPTSLDFVDPQTGAYLRLAWRSPPGEDVLGTLEGIQDRFESQYDDYVEIRLEPTTFQGFDAAISEYTYKGMHAANLQFVTGPPEEGEYGFALNFQTAEAEWEPYQPIFERFQSSFTPP